MSKDKHSGCVYFIQAGVRGPIKIGYSDAGPEERLSGLQTSNHESLRIVATISGANRSVERRLHGRFRDIHIRGEWFRADPSLLNYIEVNAVPWVEGRQTLPEAEVASPSKAARFEGMSEKEAAAWEGGYRILVDLGLGILGIRMTADEYIAKSDRLQAILAAQDAPNYCI